MSDRQAMSTQYGRAVDEGRQIGREIYGLRAAMAVVAERARDLGIPVEGFAQDVGVDAGELRRVMREMGIE
jgi:hypothetical protein